MKLGAFIEVTSDGGLPDLWQRLKETLPPNARVQLLYAAPDDADVEVHVNATFDWVP